MPKLNTFLPCPLHVFLPPFLIFAMLQWLLSSLLSCFIYLFIYSSCPCFIFYHLAFFFFFHFCIFWIWSYIHLNFDSCCQIALLPKVCTIFNSHQQSYKEPCFKILHCTSSANGHYPARLEDSLREGICLPCSPRHPAFSTMPGSLQVNICWVKEEVHNEYLPRAHS